MVFLCSCLACSLIILSRLDTSSTSSPRSLPSSTGTGINSIPACLKASTASSALRICTAVAFLVTSPVFNFDKIRATTRRTAYLRVVAMFFERDALVADHFPARLAFQCQNILFPQVISPVQIPTVGPTVSRKLLQEAPPSIFPELLHFGMRKSSAPQLGHTSSTMCGLLPGTSSSSASGPVHWHSLHLDIGMSPSYYPLADSLARKAGGNYYRNI